MGSQGSDSQFTDVFTVANLDNESHHQTKKNHQSNDECSEKRERERKAKASCRCYLAAQLNDGIYPEDCLNVTLYLDHFKYQRAGSVAPTE